MEKQIIKLEQAISLLKEYEQWEADVINDNDMWWPYVAEDVFSGNHYDKMIELQTKRNKLFETIKDGEKDN